MGQRFVFNPLTAKFDIINVGSSGTPSIPEVYNTDPISPNPEDTWILAIEVNVAGEAMGIMGLTYSGDVGSFKYKLSYRTLEGTTIRTVLS